MDRTTKEAIELAISMALIFAVGSHQDGLPILLGAAFGAGYYGYRKRRSGI